MSIVQYVKWPSVERAFFSRSRFFSTVNEMKEEQVVCTLQYKSGTCQLPAIGLLVELDASHLLAIGPGGIRGGVGNYKKATQHRVHPNPLRVFGAHQMHFSGGLRWREIWGARANAAHLRWREY